MELSKLSIRVTSTHLKILEKYNMDILLSERRSKTSEASNHFSLSHITFHIFPFHDLLTIHKKWNLKSLELICVIKRKDLGQCLNNIKAWITFHQLMKGRTENAPAVKSWLPAHSRMKKHNGDSRVVGTRVILRNLWIDWVRFMSFVDAERELTKLNQTQVSGSHLDSDWSDSVDEFSINHLLY